MKAGGPAPFAERFREEGFAAIAFDYRNFGGSGGQPRKVLSVPRQRADYSTVIGWAVEQPYIDPRQIIAWGTSFAGMHVVELGEVGLERLVPERRLNRLKCKVNQSGAIAIAVPALLPPRFPLTPFLLTCGALDVNRTRFFITFGLVRLLRFSVEAVLARIYSRGVLAVLQSDRFETIIIGFIVLAVIGTMISAMMLWRSTHQKQLRPA